MVIANGVYAATSSVYGTITPIVIPEMTSLQVSEEAGVINGLNPTFTTNSINPDLKICKMVEIRDSQEVVSYIVL